MAPYPELYYGKHNTIGVNVQVASTLVGGLAWISDPIEGSRHDTHWHTDYRRPLSTFTKIISTVVAWCSMTCTN
jgi:ectoine hydroxylase-related dioxygenase (phytanoyl-CoA dioxygenase family)